MAFIKAERKQAKLRLALTGPSGSGKTYSALILAKGLGGKIAMIDTEHGSGSLYADLLDFDTMMLEAPFSPERYIEGIRDAERAGYDVLIIDSATHEWSGSGGCLDINEKVSATKFKGNSWSAWNETGARHRAFVDAMLQSRLHIIVTTRSKTETAQQSNEQGRKTVVKLGMKSEQREGWEYEFTTVLDLTHDGNYATASKDRTRLFGGADPVRLTPEHGQRLLEWLSSGAAVAPVPPSAPPAPADSDLITDAEAETLAADLAAAKVDVARFLEHFHVGDLDQLTTTQAARARAMLEKRAAKRPPAAHGPQGTAEQRADAEAIAAEAGDAE